MNTAISIIAASVAVIAGLAGAAAEDLKEIRSGFLLGYLTKAEYPDSVGLLPPPPAPGSQAMAVDLATSERSLQWQDTPRFDLAREDANILFPDAAKTFSCALGITITEATTPTIYRVLRRSMTDAGFSTYSAKNKYDRTRPFMANGAPVCTPEYDAELRMGLSYPSGHTAIGWAWALILSEIAPEKADAILQRGWAYGESRIVCNVHWASDVSAGRTIGSTTVALLHANDQFLADMKIAKIEYGAALEMEPALRVGCNAEVEALSYSLSSAK